MTFNPAATRRQFPIFASSPSPLHYLDNAATAQLPQCVLDALILHETTQRANVLRGSYPLAEAATHAYENARAAVARFLNAPGGRSEVVFTSGATASLNLMAHAWGALLCEGDEIVLSQAEHHSNLIPWQQLGQQRGIRLKFLPVLPDGRLDVEALPQVVTSRCRLVALTHASNVTGAITPVPAVVAAARAVGAPVLLDGAQAAQHGPVDVDALGVDFYAFSGHKCFGPNGVGVLWGRCELLERMPPFHGGGGMVARVSAREFDCASVPARFEAGTPPIAQAVGFAAALDWIAVQPWRAIRDHERQLTENLLRGLATMPRVRLIGPSNSEERLPVVSFEVDGIHPHDLCQVLGDTGIALRGGTHCAQPLLNALGSSAVSRASLALYNDQADIEALLAGVECALEVLK